MANTNDYYIPVTFPDKRDESGIAGVPPVPFVGHAGFIYVNGSTGTAAYADVTENEGKIEVREIVFDNYSLPQGRPLDASDFAPVFKSYFADETAAGDGARMVGSIYSVPSGSYVIKADLGEGGVINRDIDRMNGTPYDVVFNNCTKPVVMGLVDATHPELSDLTKSLLANEYSISPNFAIWQMISSNGGFVYRADENSVGTIPSLGLPQGLAILPATTAAEAYLLDQALYGTTGNGIFDWSDSIINQLRHQDGSRLERHMDETGACFDSSGVRTDKTSYGSDRTTASAVDAQGNFSGEMQTTWNDGRSAPPIPPRPPKDIHATSPGFTLSQATQRMVGGHPIHRLDELLPWNWKAGMKSQRPAVDSSGLQSSDFTASREDMAEASE